jgi:hypothetical protein
MDYHPLIPRNLRVVCLLWLSLSNLAVPVYFKPSAQFILNVYAYRLTLQAHHE